MLPPALQASVLAFCLSAMENSIYLYQINNAVQASDLNHPLWQTAPAVRLTRYYSGALAPSTRHAEARLLWTPAALCVRFQCRQAEPLVASSAPQTKTKTIGLWNYDVCEIFVALDANAPEHYFEFEVAPTGEWLDLEVNWNTDGRVTNWEYASGMTAAAGRDAAGAVCVAMRIPWGAFGCAPRAGDVWRANLFRCVGRDTPEQARGYLAWQPTHTPEPNFHVPAAFGQICFDG